MNNTSNDARADRSRRAAMMMGVLAGAILAGGAGAARAADDVMWFTVDGGGGSAGDGAGLVISGTFGQHDTVVMSHVSGIELSGGFWAFVPEPGCRTDFNGDGFIEPGDLDEFITNYFSSDPEENARCDFNNDGFIEPGDLDEFITAYFEGCD